MNFIEKVNLYDLLQQLGIKNIKEKDCRFVAHCPNLSHLDKTPSWTIYKDTGHHICFSCGFEGSLNFLVKYIIGKNIQDFLNISNYNDFIFNRSLENKKLKKSFDIIYKGIRQSIGNVYKFSEGPEYYRIKATNYIFNRNINKEFVDFFDIKWCIECVYNKTTFSNRIIIPIYEDKKLVSVEGRDYLGNQKPKVLYPKGGTVNTLFNIDNLDFNKPLIVVEGIMDLVLIWLYITKNVTCTFGSNLSLRQIELLCSIRNLIIMPDLDEAGHKMILQIDSKIEHEYEIALLPLREYIDIEGIKIRIPGDPGQAHINELNIALQNRVSSVKYFMMKANIIKYKKIEW